MLESKNRGCLDDSVSTFFLRAIDPVLDERRSYAEFYTHDVMLCQPHNPCGVKWKVLGFWMGDEMGDFRKGGKSNNGYGK